MTTMPPFLIIKFTSKDHGNYGSMPKWSPHIAHPWKRLISSGIITLHLFTLEVLNSRHQNMPFYGRVKLQIRTHVLLIYMLSIVNN